MIFFLVYQSGRTLSRPAALLADELLEDVAEESLRAGAKHSNGYAICVSVAMRTVRRTAA